METDLNNVVRAVESTRRALDSVARNQAQLVDHDDFHSLEEIGNVLTPLESAKLDVAVAYSIASLYFVLLRAEGCSQQSHPIKAELDRIKGYVQRIKRMENEMPQSGDKQAAAEDPSNSHSDTRKAGARVASVIERVINHELGIKKKNEEMSGKRRKISN